MFGVVAKWHITIAWYLLNQNSEVHQRYGTFWAVCLLWIAFFHISCLFAVSILASLVWIGCCRAVPTWHPAYCSTWRVRALWKLPRLCHFCFSNIGSGRWWRCQYIFLSYASRSIVFWWWHFNDGALGWTHFGWKAILRLHNPNDLSRFLKLAGLYERTLDFGFLRGELDNVWILEVQVHFISKYIHQL